MTPTMSEARAGNPAFQVYMLLRAGFTMAPILFGIDKFFNWMVDWPEYLAPWLEDLMPWSAQSWMYFVGVVEIAAGLTVLVVPWIGGLLVAGWLFGIIVNLLTYDPPLYYDIALRDLGLMLGALALWRLALAFRSAGDTSLRAAPKPPAAER